MSRLIIFFKGFVTEKFIKFQKNVKFKNFFEFCFKGFATHFFFFEFLKYVINVFFLNLAALAPPPTKRPNKDPMPSFRPSPEQYAAMIEAAAAAGQPLPRTHVN